MDDVPERPEDDVPSSDPPVTRREDAGPATERVRILGAEPAGEITSELPVVGGEPDAVPGTDTGEEPDAGLTGPEPDTSGLDPPTVRLTDEPGEAPGAGPAVDPVVPGQTAVPAAGTPTELPHWTEPPTGQVPAVLARDTGGEGGRSRALRSDLA